MSKVPNHLRLRVLMSRYRVNCLYVAKCLNKSVQTVREWRCVNDNNISDNLLELLEMKLERKEQTGLQRALDALDQIEVDAAARKKREEGRRQ